MSSSFLTAAQSIAAALSSKRIGTPVFARIVNHTAGQPDETEGELASALGACCRWIGDEPTHVTALGSMSDGPVSVLVELAGGQTALVSAGTHGESPPLVETVVVGTGGAVAHEPGGLGTSAVRASEQSSPAVLQRVLEAVRHSLQQQSPVRVPDLRPTGAETLTTEHPDTGATNPRQPKATSPPYGVLLVSGAHCHQENYAEAFAADERCRLIGVADEANVSARRDELNKRLARALGIPMFADLDQALRRDDVHIVSVVADPPRRARIAVRCAEAGKHLYLDKPMAASVAAASAVVRAIDQAGVVSQMFSQVRSIVAQRLRGLVRSGSLGQLQAIHLDLTFAKGPAGTVGINRPRKESAIPTGFEAVDAKRELFNVGVYPLVLVQWLLGRPVRRVRATTGNYFFAEHRRNDMEDFAALLFELDGGLTVSMAVGRTGWRSHPMGGLNRACVIGSKGTATIDAYRPRCEVWADEMPWLPPRIDPEDPMGFWKSTIQDMEAGPKRAWLTSSYRGPGDAEYFLDCVQQGRTSDVSARVGAAAVRTLMAAYRSAATGQFVELRT